MDFAVPADHRVKLMGREKRDKYLDLARELKKQKKTKKKQTNCEMTVLLFVIGSLGTVTKGLVQGLEYLEIRGRVETILTKVGLRSARILRRVLDTWGDFLSLRLQWKTIR